MDPYLADAYADDRIKTLLCEACRDRLAREAVQPSRRQFRKLLRRARRNPGACPVCGAVRA